MSAPPGLYAYKMAFELCPVILTGGIASPIGGYLPIIAITETISFVNGILSGGTSPSPDDFFANFQPLSGSTLIELQVAEYPFANQAVAANAIITQPLSISLLMVCPARGPGGYFTKLATMSALVSALTAHNAQGGTYTVATPSYIYTNCLLLKVTDVSTGDTLQRQSKYQWDFRQPLLTLQQAQQAQNSLMSQLSAQTPINGTPSWSGLPTSLSGVGSPLNIAPVMPVSSQPLGPPGSSSQLISATN
jgi:hypothetical protein